MAEIIMTKKPSLTERIQTIKDSLAATALAYKKWTQDVEKQANTRNASQQVFRNTAINAGSLAGEIVEVLDELSAKIVKLNESAKRQRDESKLSVGTDSNSPVMTAVLPEAKEI